MWLRNLLFLGLVAIFSFYSAFVGYRVLGQKAAYKGEKVATALDWCAAGFTFISSALLAFLGAVKPSLVQNLGIRPSSSAASACGSRAMRHGPSRTARRKRCSGGTRISPE